MYISIYWNLDSLSETTCENIKLIDIWKSNIYHLNNVI